METILIERFKQEEKQILGNLKLYDSCGEIVFTCKTLELPWKNNERNISCIHEGGYIAVKHTSPRLGRSIWLQNVHGRSEILIHKGNYHTDIQGCILVGKQFVDINGDGFRDVTSSSKTMKKLLNYISDKTLTIHISNLF